MKQAKNKLNFKFSNPLFPSSLSDLLKYFVGRSLNCYKEGKTQDYGIRDHFVENWTLAQGSLHILFVARPIPMKMFFTEPEICFVMT